MLMSAAFGSLGACAAVQQQGAHAVSRGHMQQQQYHTASCCRPMPLERHTYAARSDV
jgi:hypothetical protein